MKRLFILIAVLLWAVNTHAVDCGPLGCLLYAGTVCVDGKCVPSASVTPTPSPVSTVSDIRMDMVPLKDISVKEVDCSVMAVKSIRVFLKRAYPPPPASFYSLIHHTHEDLLKNMITDSYIARKDIMNRYVFLLIETETDLKPQFHGQDFAFNQWENLAFKDIFQSMTCAELKKSGYIFTSGVSIKGDRSDFEGVSFTFK